MNASDPDLSREYFACRTVYNVYLEIAVARPQAQVRAHKHNHDSQHRHTPQFLLGDLDQISLLNYKPLIPPLAPLPFIESHEDARENSKGPVIPPTAYFHTNHLPRHIFLALQLRRTRNLVRCSVSLGLALSIVDAKLDPSIIRLVGTREADRIPDLRSRP